MGNCVDKHTFIECATEFVHVFVNAEKSKHTRSLGVCVCVCVFGGSSEEKGIQRKWALL